jgi:hypothetical protein
MGYAALEKGDAEFSFAAASRLADALGLGLDELSGRAEVLSAESKQNDAARLGALLSATGTLMPVGAICELLDWSIERLHAAEAELDRRLEGVGMRIRRSTSRLAVERADSALDNDTLKAAVRRHLNRDHLNLTEAKLLRSVAHGDVPTQPNNAEKVALGVLVNAGLVEFAPAPSTNAEAPMMLSDDVRYSLLLDELPADEGSAPRPRRSPATASGRARQPRPTQPTEGSA